MLTTAKSLRNFRFCVLAGTEDVRLEGNQVLGRFKDPLKEFYGLTERRLVEDFLNWPADPARIVRFISKYGPLQSEPIPGEKFQVHLDGWEMDQKHFIWLWQNMRHFPDWEPRGGQLAFRKGWLTYTASNLYMFLYLDLVTCEAKRLRTCKRPDCPHPYFIAGHLKQRFCSDHCAAWGQREWKKAWWHEHGNEWRKKLRTAKSKERK